MDGYASTAHFLETAFGIDRRRSWELLRVGRAIEGLPLLARGHARGELSFSNVREVSRVATPETEGAWIAFAQGRTCREVERAVARHLPGEGPDSEVPAGRPDVVTRITIEMGSEAYAVFLQAVDKIKRGHGGRPGLAECVEMMAAEVLATPDHDATDAGGGDRPPYQVVITRPMGSAEAEVQTPKGPVRADPETVEAAACDAEVVDLTKEGAPKMRTIPPRIRERVMLRAGKRCEVPGCPHRLWLHVHHEGGWRRVGHAEGALLVLCGLHHRARHRGTLRVERGPDGTLGFLHADGRPFGAPWTSHVGTPPAGGALRPARSPDRSAEGVRAG